MPKGPAKNPGTVRFTARLEGPKERSGWVIFPYSVSRNFMASGVTCRSWRQLKGSLFEAVLEVGLLG